MDPDDDSVDANSQGKLFFILSSIKKMKIRKETNHRRIGCIKMALKNKQKQSHIQVHTDMNDKLAIIDSPNE